MRIELDKEGVAAVIVGVNDSTAAAYGKEFTERAAFPLFQDQADVGVFELQGGHKDDFFVYDKEGRLTAWFPIDGGPNSNLTTDEGYRNVKSAVVAAAR